MEQTATEWDSEIIIDITTQNNYNYNPKTSFALRVAIDIDDTAGSTIGSYWTGQLSQTIQVCFCFLVQTS